MSLKRNCDICGEVIDDSIDDKAYSDVVIFTNENEEPTYEFEDLCDTCKDRLFKAIENAMHPKATEKEAIPMQICDIASDDKDDDNITPPGKGDTKPISAVSPTETEHIPNVPRDDIPLANGVTRQFPITKRQSDNTATQ